MSNHRPHQRRTLGFTRHQNLLLAHGCGTGKTREGMYIIAQHPGPALILAPVSILESVWIEHYKMWMPSNIPVLLWGRSRSRQQKLLSQTHRVYVTSYDSAKGIYNDIQNKQFKTILLDESSSIRNYSTQRASLCLALAGIHTRGGAYKVGKAIPHRYAMSGTPAPNSEMDWWTQVKFVAGLYAGFHANYYRFREKYFVEHMLNQTVRQYKFRDMMFDDFHTTMAPWVDAIKTEDVLPDLESAIEVRKVVLSDKERKAYKEMKENMVALLNDEKVTTKNALTRVMCLREITSGFLYEKELVHMLGTSKITELIHLLTEIGNNRTIIWYNYEAEKQMILQALGNRVRWLGDVGNERNKNLVDFKDNKFQYLLANPKSLKFGQNMQYVHHMVFFCPTASYDDYEQCMRRIVRSGQEHKCFVYFLVASKTYDERLLKMIQTKEKRSHKSLDYFRR